MRSLATLVFFISLLSCSKEEVDNQLSFNNLYYDKAYEYRDTGMADSAFFYFSQAKDIFVEISDSLNIANCLINMAIIQKNQSDYFGAQETALQALEYLDQSNPEHRIYLSANYNNIAAATDHLKDFNKAISFYKLAIKFADDSANSRIYQNNMAISYQYLERYDEAIKLYDEILKKTVDNPREYARVSSNLARAKWLKTPTYQAVPEFLTALEIRGKEKDLWGQNASYSHLADYYEKEKPDSAFFYARKMYFTAQKISSVPDQIQALEKMVKVGRPDSVKYYFEIYQQLNDSIQTARAAAKNQFALIRYEVEKNKADNLRLQKENAEKINRLTRQRFFIGSLVFLLILFVAGGRFWYKKRKQRLELEAQHKIKASQLKTSRKVHDVVANGIYRVMSEIENKEDIDREGILDKLEGVYHKSRDISYEAEDSLPAEQSYAQQITELLTSFATAHQKVLIVGNESQLWHHVNENVKAEIKHVLQELMVNMRKHSHTDQVVIRFGKNEGKLKIFYKDNGVGIKNVHAQGNGLKNTGSRIKNLDGEIIFVSETGNGLKVEIAIPIS